MTEEGAAEEPCQLFLTVPKENGEQGNDGEKDRQHTNEQVIVQEKTADEEGCEKCRSPQHPVADTLQSQFTYKRGKRTFIGFVGIHIGTRNIRHHDKVNGFAAGVALLLYPLFGKKDGFDALIIHTASVHNAETAILVPQLLPFFRRSEGEIIWEHHRFETSGEA